MVDALSRGCVAAEQEIERVVTTLAAAADLVTVRQNSSVPLLIEWLGRTRACRLRAGAGTTPAPVNAAASRTMSFTKASAVCASRRTAFTRIEDTWPASSKTAIDMGPTKSVSYSCIASLCVAQTTASVLERSSLQSTRIASAIRGRSSLETMILVAGSST